MKAFAVTVPRPEGYVHSHAFDDVATAVADGLRELGHDVLETSSVNVPCRQHIVFGATLLGPWQSQSLAADAILYNLEQIERGSEWCSDAYLELLAAHRVWDYSQSNAQALAELGIQVERVVPIGWAGELERVKPAQRRDIDVAFFGSMCSRRGDVLKAMSTIGLRTRAFFGVYGAERDAILARSHLVLNVHMFEAKVLEAVRITYLLGNGCTVLSERGANPDEDAPYEAAVGFADYEYLPAAALTLLCDEKLRHQLAVEGRKLMRRRPMRDYLREALA